MPLNIDGIPHYTVKEVAEKAGITVSAVYKLFLRVRLIAKWTALGYLVSEEEYEKWHSARRGKGRPSKL